MNDVTARNGVATQALEDQLNVFNAKTANVLENLGMLSTQFDSHGRALADAAATVEQSNRNTTASVSERKAMLESLVTTIDQRTTDLDQRLSRFTSLLDESLAAAEERARDIARVVAGNRRHGLGYDHPSVRSGPSGGRGRTPADLRRHAPALPSGTQEADAMFKQSADKFAAVVTSLKEMTGEMQRELDTTRSELRRGVLEMPQEAAESTSQMRKVIVDQIEALAELNRIVARHGRGLDVASTRSTAFRAKKSRRSLRSADATRRRYVRGLRVRATTIHATTITARRACPRPISACPARAAPKRRRSAPAGNTDQANDGWLSGLLNRADNGNSTWIFRALVRSSLPMAAIRGNRCRRTSTG